MNDIKNQIILFIGVFWKGEWGQVFHRDKFVTMKDLTPLTRFLKLSNMTPSWIIYRGLTPHKIMPMPGTHQRMHADSHKRHDFCIRKSSATYAYRWFKR